MCAYYYMLDICASARICTAHRSRSIVIAATNMVYPGGPAGFDISPLRPTVPEDLAAVDQADAAPEDYGGPPNANPGWEY